MLDCGNAKKNREELLDTLKTRNLPKFRREPIADDLQEACGFQTDYRFITKSKIKTIRTQVKEDNKLPCFVTVKKSL